MKRLIALLLVTLGITLTYGPTSHAANNTYVALGDSVAAGAGLLSTDPLCKRSTQSYPYTVAQRTGLKLENYSCSGAKTDEGIYDNQTSQIPAQLDQAFTNGTPELITLTIGANDTRWTQFIHQCYYFTCGYKVDTGRFATYLADFKLELNVALAKISTLSNGTPPRVIVTGYYNPFANSSNACDDTERLTSKEISWMRARTQSLNNAISRTVSKYSFASYAPVSFRGHELCSEDSWVQGLSDAAPFHPTANGEEAIADAVIAKYSQPNQSTSQKSTRERFLDWYNRNRE